MENTELQLFDPKELSNIHITNALLEHKSPRPTYNPQKSIEEGLNALFPTHKEETKLQKARRVLGEISLEVTDEQLEVFLSEVQFLLDSWLDCFEKDLFDGLTLKQILKGK